MTPGLKPPVFGRTNTYSASGSGACAAPHGPLNRSCEAMSAGCRPHDSSGGAVEAAALEWAAAAAAHPSATAPMMAGSARRRFQYRGPMVSSALGEERQDGGVVPRARARQPERLA